MPRWIFVGALQLATGCSETDLASLNAGPSQKAGDAGDARADGAFHTGPDAGALDAHSSDAGLDAKRADSGGPDAKPGDAAREAAPVDAGAADASPLDAGDSGIALLLAGACGRVPVTLDDWERCYQRRWCDWEVNCVTLNNYSDVQDCIDNSNDVEGGRLEAERRLRRRAIEAGRASLDVDAFSRCILETNRQRCNTAYTAISCANRFKGTVADGGLCYADVECASPGAVCNADCSGACCTGTCQPKFKEGETCDLYYSCEPGFECHDVCIAGDIGTPCASMRDCDPNAWCDLQTGICKADLPVGSPCTSLLQCGGQTMCVGLSIVSADPGRCLTAAGAGGECDDFCYGNRFCNSSGICQELPGLGENCSALLPCNGANVVCGSGGLCVPRGDVGAACTNTQACLASLFCTSELNEPNPKCASRRSTGEPCASPAHCESYLCSGNANRPGVCLPWMDTCPDAGP